MKLNYHHRMRNKPGISLGWIIPAALLVVVSVLGGLYWDRSVQNTKKSVPVYPLAKDSLVVFLAFPGGEKLAVETREIPERRGKLSLGEDIVRELLHGPEEASLERIAPPEAELKAFYIDTDGIVYIDLDRQALGLPKDAFGEYLAIQSFFQSLRRNIPGIKAVKFLIDSKEVDTLWGHIDAASAWRQEYEELL